MAIKALLCEIRYSAMHHTRTFFGCVQGETEKYFVFPDSNGDDVFQRFQAFSLECGPNEWDGYEKVDLEIPEFLEQHTPKAVEWGVCCRPTQPVKPMLTKRSILRA